MTKKTKFPDEKPKPDLMERFSGFATKFAGSTRAFILAIAVILIWLITGPIFHFSNTWQLIINTGTTIVTFIMVFLIQRTQNKDSLVMQLKLNELIASKHGASNRLINLEDISEEELQILRKYYHRLADKARLELDLRETHSIEEAEELHELKKKHWED